MSPPPVNTTANWPPPSVSPQLGNNTARPYGLALHPGTTSNDTYTNRTNSPEIHDCKPRTSPRDRGSGTQADKYRCHRADNITLLHKPDIYPQKGLRTMAPHPKSQEAKQSPQSLPLQDGRLAMHPVHTYTSGLHGQSGSEGCLPHSVCPPHSQEVPPIHLEGEDLSVQNHALWAEHRSIRVHENNESTNCPLTILRDSTYSISRRYTDISHLRAAPISEHNTYYFSTNSTRLHNQLCEVSSHTLPEDRIPWHDHRLPSYDSEPTSIVLDRHYLTMPISGTQKDLHCAAMGFAKTAIFPAPIYFRSL